MRALFVLLIVLGFAFPGFALTSLEQDLARLFVGNSFTIRNFYRGTTLRYGSDGELLGKGEPGYWSRDGMVEFSSVKLSKDNILLMEGKRTCVLFDPSSGEFSNVWTGDKVQIEVQLKADQLSLEAAARVLQKILLSSHDRLADLVPPYWANCLRRKVDRADKRSPWECVASDKKLVPDFSGKKISWDIPPPDHTLHTGRQLYLIKRRVAYLEEEGVKAPTLQVVPDPLFEWGQRRTKLDEMTLVLAFTVGEAGTARDIFIVSPVGMGMDDDAVETVSQWRFSPAVREGKPCAVNARVIFDIAAPNTRPNPR